MKLAYEEGLYNPDKWFIYGMTYTFKKQIETGCFVNIEKEDDSWNGLDYSGWFMPENYYDKNTVLFYFPIDSCLEDGTYQIYYKEFDDFGKVVMRFVLEFELLRGK